MAWIDPKRTTAGREVRYDVGYRDPAGKVRRKTFHTHREATAFKRRVEAETDAGTWIDPRISRTSFAEYASRWLARKEHTLAVRTIEGYESQLRLHILPVLGPVPLSRLTASTIADWWHPLSGLQGPGKSTASKCYRLTKSILATAVAEDVIPKNPCNIRGAGQEPARKREGPSIATVLDLVEVVRPKRRLLVNLGAFSGLRTAEMLALRRRHVDPLRSRLIIEESVVETAKGVQLTKEPKSDAGRRNLTLDAWLMSEVERHLAEHVGIDPDAYLFTGDRGGLLRRNVWQKEWTAACKKVGVPGAHFHDTRHTAGTLLMQTGATPKETMRRLGHSTMRAAMIYQDAVDERDVTAAEAVGQEVARIRRERASGQLRDGRAMDG